MLNRKYILIIAGICLLFSAAFAEAKPIVIKSVISNPDIETPQTIPFRLNLPQEVKPEHILDMMDLKIDLDSKIGQYFVYKDITLQPGETREIVIKISDVWRIDENILAEIKGEAYLLSDALTNSQYAEQAEFYRARVENKINDIITRQEEAEANMGAFARIKLFRELSNEILLLKGDIQSLKEMQDRASTTKKEKKEEQKDSMWIYILATLGSLFILSLPFFVILLKGGKK